MVEKAPPLPPQLAAQIQALEGDLEAAREAAQELQARSSQLRAQSAILKAQLLQLAQSAADEETRARVRLLQAQLDSVVAALGSAGAELSQTADEIEALELALGDLNACNAEAALAEISTQVENVIRNLQQLEAQLNMLQTRLNQLGRDVAALLA